MTVGKYSIFSIKKNLFKIMRRDSKKYLSTTRFIKSLFSDFNPDEACKNILSSKKMNDKNYEYFGMNEKEIQNLWKFQIQSGKKLHKNIQDYYLGIKQENISPEFQYFLNFVSDNPQYELYSSEKKIFSNKYLISGIPDAIYKIKDKNYALCDWKRVKKMDTCNHFEKYSTFEPISYYPDTNYYHYCLQLNIYKFILEEEYDIIVDEMMLVVLHPNNKGYLSYIVPTMEFEMMILFHKREFEIMA